MSPEQDKLQEIFSEALELLDLHWSQTFQEQRAKLPADRSSP